MPIDSNQSQSFLFKQQASELPENGYALVAFERGIDIQEGGLTYIVPEFLKDLKIGERVIAPLGKSNKETAGYVIDLLDMPDWIKRKLDAGKNPNIKEIKNRADNNIALNGDLIELAKWISRYYCCPLGMVLATMLPAAVKRGTGSLTKTLIGINNAEQEPDIDNIANSQTRNKTGFDAVSSKDNAKDSSHRQKNNNTKIKLSKLQRAILEEVKKANNSKNKWVEINELAQRSGAKTTSPVKRLLNRGLLKEKRVEIIQSDLDLRASKQTDENNKKLILNSAQKETIDSITKNFNKGFNVNLIRGVTGSGKTEVYLRLIEALRAGRQAGGDTIFQTKNNSSSAGLENNNVLYQPSTDSGRGACPTAGVIILVPEISLTPQTVARFLNRFDKVAVLHSGLTQAQRNAQWQRISASKANIVIGARSAVFAPLKNLSLIIVDEEHEPSYKQDQLPRYSARDVAIKRGQIGKFPVVLGSATPSLESYYNAIEKDSENAGFHRNDKCNEAKGFTSLKPRSNLHKNNLNYYLFSMPDRVKGMQLPEVEITDMIEDRRQRKGIHLISSRLEHELSKVLQTENSQAMLLLNRRGFGNYIACPDHRCGWMMRCEHCDAALVYHKNSALPAGGVVRCHHCTYEQLLAKNCPDCNKKITVFGLGVQRVEEEINRKFPNAKVIRMDSDTMKSGRHYQRALDDFKNGKADILLGTQMISKGLDIPSVTLVGVISGDTAMHMPDFRAAERTFQLIAQVAGRAGRSEKKGRVIVQTFNVDDPTINLAAKHDYVTFAEKELQLRQEMNLPPISRMARIIVRNQEYKKANERAKELKETLDKYNQNSAVEVRAPAPCPVSKIADYYREQIELIAPPPKGASALQRLLTALRAEKRLISDSATAIDVDPAVLM